ncbi:MAG: N-acetylmuramic acid 6-phosphate etherase [Ancalomicrobiaceae bacterium]|nr:N-acetylmuramic acid 6-phosphate etherase [Ancalomicrobiaceae bacterium]
MTTLPTTEQALAAYRGLDLWPAGSILAAIADAQTQAIGSVRAALPAIEAASAIFAEALKAGGRVIYVGAGSSGLIAELDALELPGTFGIKPAQVAILVAGKPAATGSLTGETEDDAEAGRAEMAALEPTEIDCVVAVSASGSTAYTLAAAEEARARGASVVGMACNAGSALLVAADVPVLLPTPPEVLAGSTRMNAGTAQKCALNMLSTLSAVRLGHVHDGMMVNVQADNAKLKGRAAGIIARICGIGAEAARARLEAAGNDVKTAILIERFGSIEAARAALLRHGGHLRPALQEADTAGR